MVGSSCLEKILEARHEGSRSLKGKRGGTNGMKEGELGGNKSAMAHRG